MAMISRVPTPSLHPAPLRQPQHLSGVNAMPAAQPVVRGNGALRKPVAPGNFGEGVAAPHPVARGNARARAGLPRHAGLPVADLLAGAGGQLQNLPHENAVAVAQPVAQRNFAGPHAVAPGNAAQRVASPHPVVEIGALGAVALGIRQPGQRQPRLGLAARHAQVVMAGDELLPGPHRAAQGGIGLAQGVQRNAEGLRQGFGPVVVLQLQRYRAFRGIFHHPPEPAPGLLLNLQRRQKRGVEVLGGEAEGAAFVARNDLGDVGGAQLAGRPGHARGAVVVGGDRQGPGAGALAVQLQQLCRGMGGAEGVVALVHHMVNAQKQPPGGARELPNARSPGVRAGIGIEGGFHMGQGHQLGGQAVLFQGLANVVLPAAHAPQPFPEVVGLPQLEADAVGGGAQSGPGDILREHREHPGLLGAQVVAAPAGQAPQQVAVVLAALIQPAAALPAVFRGGQPHRLIDDGEILGIVKKARPGIHLGVDPQPKGHPGPQGGGFGEILGGGQGRARQCENQHGEARAPRQPPENPGLCHHRLTSSRATRPLGCGSTPSRPACGLRAPRSRGGGAMRGRPRAARGGGDPGRPEGRNTGTPTWGAP